jgi:phosphate transport system protein
MGWGLLRICIVGSLRNVSGRLLAGWWRTGEQRATSRGGRSVRGGFAAAAAHDDDTTRVEESGAVKMTEAQGRRGFQEALGDLRSDVVKLAALVTESIGAGTHALLDADLALVDQLVADDQQINELHHHIELDAYRLLAMQQPTAGDLRAVLAVLRILHEIQLGADLMVTTGKAARRLYPQQLPPRVRGILERMGNQAQVQMRTAVDAFADRDLARAAALPDMDDVMDDLQKDLFRAILVADPAGLDEGVLQRAVEMALVGRYYERVADHAVQIGRWVSFMVTGELPRLGGDSRAGTV